MPNFNNWISSNTRGDAWRTGYDRGIDTARLIADKSSSITVVRAGTAQAAQTVRLEPMSNPSENGQIVESSFTSVLVVGYKGHPTIADTSLERGDRFYLDGQWYDVIQVLPDIPDRLLAVARTREN